jgi:CheY-like chemotaxis protein
MTRILIVEDDELSLNMLPRHMRRKGYVIISAMDGAQSEPPDLVLMDMRLPVLNSWQATRQIEATPATSHIPIIALRAQAMASDREKSIEAGCDEYQTKPVDLPRLLNKVDALLDRKDSA